MSDRRTGLPHPGWLTALLIADVVGAALMGLALFAMTLGLKPRDWSYNTGVVIVFALLPVILSAGATWLAAVQWRRGAATAAVILAVLPVAVAGPFVLFTLGIG